MRSFIRKRDRVDSVEIVGKCFSSCPIFLDHPASCIHRGATFGFHGLSKWGRYASWDIQIDYTRYLGNPMLGDWFLANAARSTDMVYLSGSDLIDDFGERECPA